MKLMNLRNAIMESPQGSFGQQSRIGILPVTSASTSKRHARRVSYFVRQVCVAAVMGLGIVTALAEPAGPGWHYRSVDPQSLPSLGQLTIPGSGPAALSPEEQPLEGGGGVMLLSGGGGPGVSNLVAETARALQYDPARIYEFVRNEIDYTPYYGLLRGPERTLLDRQGNDSDLAALLVELLRACPAGYPVDYVRTVDENGIGYGASFPMTSATGYDAPSWFCVSNDFSQVITVALNSGHMVNTNATHVILPHVWVRVNIGGTNYELDPSFKPCTKTNGLNLATLMNYSRSALYTAAGGTIDPDYVQSLVETNLNSHLNGLAGTLKGALQTNYPKASWEEIVGQRATVPEVVTNLLSGTQMLRFTTTQSPVYPSELPSSYHHQLTLTHGSVTTNLNLHEISHRKLWISYTNVAGSVKGQVRLDDTLVIEDSGTQGAAVAVTLNITHPYPSTVFDQQATYNLFRNTNHTYVVAMGFGGNHNGRMVEAAFKDLEEMNAAGVADSSSRKLSAALQSVGQAWLQETDLYAGINERLAALRTITHHRAGIIAQEGGYYVDLKNQVSAPYEKSLLAGLAGLKNELYAQSAMEHGVLEQLQHTNRAAVSTIRLIQDANSKGLKTFRATSNNWTTVQSQLSGYSSGDLSTFSSATSAGHTLILPQSGSLTNQQWIGKGYVDYFSSETSASMGMIIGGGYFGGFPVSQGTFSIATFNGTQTPFYELAAQIVNPVSNEPVDLQTGAYLYENKDLWLGGPMGLEFSRHYTSLARNRDRAMGYGWTHSYNITAQLHSDFAASLGRRAPQDATAALVGATVLHDLFANEDTAQSWAVSALVANWLIKEITDHSVSIYLGTRALTFNRQPDASFTPPPGMTVSLIQSNPTPTTTMYIVQERLGNTYTFNTTNRLIKITDPDGNQLTFVYQASTTNLTSVTSTSFNSKKLEFEYNASAGRMSRVKDYGTVHYADFKYDGSGNLTGVVDVAGEKWGFTYDSGHRLTSLKDPEGITTIQNFYSAQGQVTNQISGTGQPWNFYIADRRAVEVNPLGQKTTYFYDRQGRTIAVETADGSKTFTTYDGQNHPILTVDARGVTNRFEYDGDHNLKKVTEAEGTPEQRITTRVFDSSHRLIAVTNALGLPTTFAYDGEHHLTNVVDSLGVEARTVYLANGLPQIMTVVAGGQTLATTSNTYDTAGYPDKVSSTDAGTVDYLYDLYGDLTQVADANAKTNKFFYNKRRLLTNSVDAASASIKYVYYKNRLLKNTTNALGRATSYTYTAAYKPLTVTGPDGGIVTNVYDAADRPIAARNPRGYWSTNRLDSVGRVTNTVFGTDSRKFTYDPNSNTLTARDALDNLTTNQYDRLNRLVWQLLPIGEQDFEYDGLGRLTNTVDALGYPTGLTYDPLGRLTKKTRPSGAIEGFSYNGQGYRIAFTNAETRVTKFGVDAQGRVKTVTNALGQVATFRYDAVGNMTNRTDAAGVATRYLYDGINRLTNIVYASTGQKTILRYDANSNLTNAWATNSTAFAKVVTVAMRYDNRDRLTNATTTAGSASWSVGYRHDLNGNTTNIIYPGGLVCAYTFDTQDRVTKVTDWLGRETSFGYDDANRLTSITYPAANGVTASYGYDAMGRRTSYSYTKGSTLAARTLVRNALGFKYQENVTAGYAPAPSTQKLRSSTFNEADRLLSSTNSPGGSIAYGHDTKGNLTNLVSATSTNVWVWDDDNRLKSVTNNTIATSCLYDALGTRVGTLSGTTTNYFAVNQSAGLKNVLVEMNGAGTATRYYVWGPAGLICHIEAGSNATRYYHQDELGSTLLITDETGTVTDQFAYQPYGELINRTGSTVTPYKWLGGLAVRDEGNSLYYMLNRYYSSDLKRFLTEDPAGIDSWPNLYAYANLNPVFFVDPFGLGAESGGASQQTWDSLYWQTASRERMQDVQAQTAWQQLSTTDQVLSQVPVVRYMNQGRNDLALADLATIWMLGRVGPSPAGSAAVRNTENTLAVTGREWYDQFAQQYGAQNVEWASGSGRTITWPAGAPIPQAERMFRVRPETRSSTFAAELESVAGPRPPDSAAHHVQFLQLNGVDNGMINGAWARNPLHNQWHGVTTPQINAVPYGTEIILRSQ